MNRRNLLRVVLPVAMPAVVDSASAAAKSGGGIRWDFQGGRLGRAERLSEAHFRCELQGDVDQNGRNRQANWYYFRVDGVRGLDLTIDLVKLPGEYNFVPNRGAVTADTVPVYSRDNRVWLPVPKTEYDASEPRLRLHIPAESRTVWIAHVPPYTGQHLSRLLATLSALPHVRVRSIGETVEHRSIPLVTVTDPEVPDRKKKCVWLMFRQHGWETGSSWAGEGALRILTGSEPRAISLRERFIWKIIPMCDPDGVARGNVRFNTYGFDLNRNWDVEDPVRMPEITAQRRAVLDWLDRGRGVDLFLSLHNTETGEYLEGPGGPLLQRFDEVLRARSTFDPTTLPRVMDPRFDPGRATVIQGLYARREIPAFLMEQRISWNARLGRLPTLHDRMEFGAGLVTAIAETLEPGFHAASEPEEQ